MPDRDDAVSAGPPEPPGLSEEAVARKVWVLPRSDICSGVVTFGISTVAPTNLGSEVPSLLIRGTRAGVCETGSVVTPPPVADEGPVRRRTNSRVGAFRRRQRVRCGAAGRKLARRGAWALGERYAALGERRVCACVGAKRAMSACVACCSPCCALVARAGCECGAEAVAERGRGAAGARDAGRTDGAGRASVGGAGGGSG